MSRYEGLESVKTDLIASKGVVFCKFAKASQALAAMEEGVAADLNAPWWSPQAATVTIASGVVPTEQ